MSGDVLCRDTSGAFCQSRFVMFPLFAAQFSFRMRKQVCAIAAQGKHEKQFRVHPGRWNMVGGQLGDRAAKSFLELHASYFIMEGTTHKSNQSHTEMVTPGSSLLGAMAASRIRTAGWGPRLYVLPLSSPEKSQRLRQTLF